MQVFGLKIPHLEKRKIIKHTTQVEGYFSKCQRHDKPSITDYIDTTFITDGYFIGLVKEINEIMRVRHLEPCRTQGRYSINVGCCHDC